ncbi:hypothetical protein [Streptomyces sp. NRRL WC-3618]|uniref:hypothetical protein n=1 Tax=Streptomyces sp. NRRL WC-3618 TaxID=1519490 RepID=UPI000A5F6C3E|nr:hypothetical protein [Streptomyces sp. NRRL WC-3618]
MTAAPYRHDPHNPVSWAAKTAGVTSYDIGRRVVTRSGTGEWKLGPLQTWRNRTTAKSAVFGASGSPVGPTPGLTYRFSARAHDDAGQTGAWSAAARPVCPSTTGPRCCPTREPGRRRR